jgi:succinyl-CoA synthetase alpha subunit
MAILAGRHSKVLVCGIANPLARFQCEEMLRHGTQISGVVGLESDVAGWASPPLPIFFDPAVAAEASGADLAMVFTPPLEVKAVVSALIAARTPVVVCLTEHVPVHDAVILRHLAKRAGTLLIGPNSSGLLSPGRAKAGFFVEDICQPGPVGLVAKSGSLAYAVMSELKSAGLGISTVVSIGGDAVKGADFRDILALFAADPETRAIVMLGEIGGNDEENAAGWLHEHPIAKPVVGFIAGRSVPPGQAMGHAGAIAQRGRGDYAAKCNALAAAGVVLARNIGDIPRLVAMNLAVG